MVVAYWVLLASTGSPMYSPCAALRMLWTASLSRLRGWSSSKALWTEQAGLCSSLSAMLRKPFSEKCHYWALGSQVIRKQNCVSAGLSAWIPCDLCHAKTR